MKCVKINLAGDDLYLMFNGEAMFDIREKFGGSDALLETMKADTRDALDAICDAVAILAEQGELARRDMGYDAQKILKAETIKKLVMPTDILKLKLAIPSAITLGYGREIEPENGEIDLVLAEIEQKKTP